MGGRSSAREFLQGKAQQFAKVVVIDLGPHRIHRAPRVSLRVAKVDKRRHRVSTAASGAGSGRYESVFEFEENSLRGVR